MVSADEFFKKQKSPGIIHMANKLLKRHWL